MQCCSKCQMMVWRWPYFTSISIFKFNYWESSTLIEAVNTNCKANRQSRKYISCRCRTMSKKWQIKWNLPKTTTFNPLRFLSGSLIDKNHFLAALPLLSSCCSWIINTYYLLLNCRDLRKSAVKMRQILIANELFAMVM